MKAKDLKVLLYTVFIFLAFIGPVYYISSNSMKIVTGNAAINPEGTIDHYDVYCSEDSIRDLQSMEKVGEVENTNEIPPDCLRMPSAHIAYVPMDGQGNQVTQPEFRLI